ncbi:hypothetical protein PM082_015462 [Marasmius tenuissimus]|nr:hypothetical protein PM082_015462 [Marasmius tenuissimus]
MEVSDGDSPDVDALFLKGWSPFSVPVPCEVVRENVEQEFEDSGARDTFCNDLEKRRALLDPDAFMKEYEQASEQGLSPGSDQEVQTLVLERLLGRIPLRVPLSDDAESVRARRHSVGNALTSFAGNSSQDCNTRLSNSGFGKTTTTGITFSVLLPGEGDLPGLASPLTDRTFRYRFTKGGLHGG